MIKNKKQHDYREVHKDVQKALNYEHNVYSADSYDAYMWEMEKEVLLKEINLLGKTRINYLDFACGTGRILSFVEQYVSESTGIDVSEDMLVLAKNKIRNSLLIKCDLTKEDVIKNKQYDLVSAFRFFLNAQKDLRNEVMPLLSKKMANDGILIFNIHGNISSYYFLPMIFSKIKKNREKLNAMSYFEMLSLIKNSKLNVIRVYGIGFIPSSFYRLFKSRRKYFVSLERKFSNFKFLKYFARNLIFVCTKE